MYDIHLNCKDYTEGKICYSCGKQLCGHNNCKKKQICEISETLDHIPPKGLFEQNKGYPNIISNPKKQKITVPCCKECNNTYSKDEEIFLIYITMIAAAKGSKIAEYALKDRYRTLNNNKKLGRNYVNNIKGKTYIPTESGILEPGMEFGLNKDREIKSIQKILVKIVKGFYYKYIGKTLNKEVHYCADNIFYTKIGLKYYPKHPLSEKNRLLIKELKKIDGKFNLNSKKDSDRLTTFYNENIKDDIFSYGFIRFQNEKYSVDDVLFVITFYNNLEFVLST
jgi:hypothetical protein